MPTHDDPRPEAEVSCDLAADEPFSCAVVRAVAALTGTDPAPGGSGRTLEPLYETIDPEALDAVFARSDESETRVRVTFTYYGCEVTVHGEGRVSATSLEAAPDGAAD